MQVNRRMGGSSNGCHGAYSAQIGSFHSVTVASAAISWIYAQFIGFCKRISFIAIVRE
jgi:hypothetical protein